VENVEDIFGEGLEVRAGVGPLAEIGVADFDPPSRGGLAFGERVTKRSTGASPIASSAPASTSQFRAERVSGAEGMDAILGAVDRRILPSHKGFTGMNVSF